MKSILFVISSVALLAALSATWIVGPGVEKDSESCSCLADGPCSCGPLCDCDISSR